MKGHRFFVDTNVFLRTIVKDHPKQTKDCSKFFEGLRSGSFLATTSMLVLAEIQWTLDKHYGLTKAEIVETLFSIHAISGLTISDVYKPSIALRLFESHGVKFVDTVIASHPLVHTREMAMISYDKDFDKLQVIRLEPEDVI